MAIKKYLGFVWCLLAVLMSEIDEALKARARFKEVEQVTNTGWID